jgi:hypothetical protein
VKVGSHPDRDASRIETSSLVETSFNLSVSRTRLAYAPEIAGVQCSGRVFIA